MDKYEQLTLLDIATQGEDECKKHLAFTRWDDNVVCPYCDCEKCYTTKTRYKCSDCKKLFSVTVGTIFHDSKIGLRKWYTAIYLITAHKKGISSCQLAVDLGVTQKTAWYMLHRIRNTLKQNRIKLSGVIEIDETYVGGKNKNRHWDKKVKHSQGRSFKDKTPVLGFIKRGGELRAQPIGNVSKKTIQPIVVAQIRKGSKVMTDEWKAYNDLHKRFKHKIVNHGRGQYVDGDAYTNTIEGFWSLFKRGIFGVYHKVSRKHLAKYVDEFVYRYNTRNMQAGKRMQKVIGSKERISYKRLTK